MSKTLSKANIDIKNPLSNRLLLAGEMADNGYLSKQHASGKPYRYSLAFFVPVIFPATHAGNMDSMKSLSPITGANRHKFMATLPTVYVRKDIAKYNSLLGEYAGQLLAWLRVIFGHPIFYSVLLTQKTTQGGHNNAH